MEDPTLAAMRMISDEKRRREDERPDLLDTGPRASSSWWSPWLLLGVAFPVWLPLLLAACCS